VAQIIATAPAEASHYYLTTGEPCHGNLREARKAKALPSVTTILSVLAKPGLDAWKQETAILQSLTLPRLDGEADPVFAKRVVEASRTELQAAADRGTYVHNLAEQVLRGEDVDVVEAKYRPHLESLRFWAKCVHEVVAQETVLVNEVEGYAGRVDLIAKIGDANEHEVEVIDFKTRKFRKVGTFAGGNPGVCTVGDPHKVDSYSTDLYQLAAYCYCHFEEPVKCRNVYIDPASGAIHDKLWSEEDVAEAYETFLSIAQVWRAEKNYDPRVGRE
jgi:hypothetical protein